MKCGEAGVPQLKSAGCDHDQPESVSDVASWHGRQVKAMAGWRTEVRIITDAVVPATGCPAPSSQAIDDDEHGKEPGPVLGRAQSAESSRSSHQRLRKIEEGRIAAENDELESQEACVKPRRLLSSHDVLVWDLLLA
ncbi:uncharacterized protein CCOS01_07804 [Colletotrichum costaricense]|uniref:Uncharacterized protein n=1 Tax=Colletotrichum costaricense TaxID=1209916 RepID=A0AAI9YXJ8_9PEZI|nr:uncharacterized protein CCOS01_07804 [Colletotrichum costaricense]KAK1527542.1 hypothetical protein CCOS01_07804 [Colletotrichum costaricense]